VRLGRIAIPDACCADFFRGCLDGDGSAVIFMYGSSSVMYLARKCAAADAFLSADEHGILGRGRGGTGLRDGLKIRCPQGRRGSTPLAPTNFLFLTGGTSGLYRDPSRGAVAQLGEHKAGSLGVRGSNPLSSTNFPAASAAPAS
jgi:hypothetical protein